MKRDVKISICGIHTNEGEDSVEVVSIGEMYEENDILCVSYEEASDEMDGVECEMVKNLMKIQNEQVQIIKKGPSQTHMVFMEGKDTLSYYSTPFGELEVVIHTSRLQQEQTEKGLEIYLEYALEVNAAHMSQSNVNIKIEYLS